MATQIVPVASTHEPSASPSWSPNSTPGIGGDKPAPFFIYNSNHDRS
jgi:hypothetical protein